MAWNSQFGHTGKTDGWREGVRKGSFWAGGEVVCRNVAAEPVHVTQLSVGERKKGLRL
jgi:hypothetical protein